MKTTFYFVRHGETLFNDLQIMQGKCDSPLTETGILQAEEISSALRHEHFDHVFCSSSERAYDTANIICRYHDNVPVGLKELKEFDFGELDGEPIQVFKDRIQPHRMVDDWTDVGGENVEMFKERADKAFERMLAACKDNDTVLIVSHGSFFTHLMKTHFANVDQQEYIHRMNAQNRHFVPNCSVSKFVYEDGVYTLIQEPMTPDEYRQREDKTVHFVYVRHGETVFNRQQRMQGHCDSPLTDKGIQEAEVRAKKLKGMHFDKAYTSSTERARDTAKILLRDRDIEAIPDKRLREVFYGEAECLKYPEHMDTFLPAHLNNDWSVYHGETYADLEKRLHSFFRDAVDACDDGDTVLLSGHGDLYMVIAEYLFGIKKEDLYRQAETAGKNPAGNCGMFCFDYHNGKYSYEKLMHEES